MDPVLNKAQGLRRELLSSLRQYREAKTLMAQQQHADSGDRA